jgi:8-amino-7-oxononanoate synthase
MKGRKGLLNGDARMRAVSAARAARAKTTMVHPASKVAASPAFDTLPGYRDRKLMKELGANVQVGDPTFRVLDGRPGATCTIDGRPVLNFGSYDYLGLNVDHRPAAAAKEAIDRYGVSASASRILAGGRPVHRALEEALAAHYDVEDALTFVSGHATNVSVIATLAGKDDLVVHDAYIHNSTSVGVTLSGASRRSFAHNDLGALEALLVDTAGQYRATLVVVEGHYSMDGDIPDLARLIKLKQRYGFWLMVDEAHGLGCIGATGRGVREVSGQCGDAVDIWMGTLSKTLGSTGGYIAGSAALIDILKYEAPGSVFSVALPPALAAAALCALEIFSAEPDRVRRLHEIGQVFLGCAREHGLNTGTSVGASIIPVIVGSSALAIAASGRLLDHGVNALPVTFPGVPMNAARLRFFLSSEHTEDQVRRAVRITAQVLAELKESGLENRIKDIGERLG